MNDVQNMLMYNCELRVFLQRTLQNYDDDNHKLKKNNTEPNSFPHFRTIRSHSKNSNEVFLTEG